MLEDRYRDDSEERPKQIAAHAFEGSNDGVPLSIAETSGAVGGSTGDDSGRERPGLHKEQSYQRFAPPGITPTSSIPIYPAIPGKPPAAAAAAGSQSQQVFPSAPPVQHDPTYPSQGGGYQPVQP